MTVRQYTTSPDHLERFVTAAAHPAMSRVRPLLLEAVEALPVTHRELVERMFWERLPQRLLADELGMSRRTLNVRRAEALGMLQAHLACQLIVDGFYRWLRNG